MYPVERINRTEGSVLQQRRRDGLEYLSFPALENTGIVEHLFTTRTGGVSEGMFATLNLSFHRGDDPEHVLENYRRVGKVMGIPAERMVASRQTHTTNIRLVTEADCGCGVTCAAPYEDVDGLMTREPEIALVTSFADCVPLYFVDPVHRAIGLAHSGWRGTVQRMGACMVHAMGEAFGSRPEELVAAIGPSICQKCYEVSEDVAEAFRSMLRGTKDIQEEIRNCGRYAGAQVTGEVLISGKVSGKYQLDLWLANLIVLRSAGIPLQQISVTDVCTCHNPDYLFSHRASQGKRGNLGAFLMLKR